MLAVQGVTGINRTTSTGKSVSAWWLLTFFVRPKRRARNTRRRSLLIPRAAILEKQGLAGRVPSQNMCRKEIACMALRTWRAMCWNGARIGLMKIFTKTRQAKIRATTRKRNIARCAVARGTSLLIMRAALSAVGIDPTFVTTLSVFVAPGACPLNHCPLSFV